MEVVVGIAVGALVVVILVSAAGLGILIKKKCFSKGKDHLSQQQTQNNAERDIEQSAESADRQLIFEECGDDLPITLQNVLDDDVWIDDMTGVMSHCIPILKGCHDLTSRLVPITMKECSTDEENKKVEEMALQVQPRLEDVVQLLDGPLDPRLVEARCTALYYAVSNLCLVIKSICKEDSGIPDWIETSLLDTENHLKVLQAETQKLRRRSLPSSVRGRSGNDGSLVGELSLNAIHSNSSSGSSSHTDSAESGIDIQTPSERGSEHSPHSPSAITYQLAVHDDHSDNPACAERTSNKSDSSRPVADLTISAEVHVGGPVGDQAGPDEVIEMKSFSNTAYLEDKAAV